MCLQDSQNERFIVYTKKELAETMSFLVQGVKQNKSIESTTTTFTQIHTYTRDPRSSFPFIPQNKKEQMSRKRVS